VISADKDRRAPILARHEVHADPRMLRQVLRQVTSDLRDVEGETRRKVALLLGVLADQWARQNSSRDEHSLIVDIEHLPNRVRVEAFSHAALPENYWKQVGPVVAAGLADTWGLERRHRSGIWFELKAAGSTD
jgi:hypothetical protein